METMTIAILSLCGAIAGFVAAYVIVNNVVLKKRKAQILKEAETEGDTGLARRCCSLFLPHR